MLLRMACHFPSWGILLLGTVHGHLGFCLGRNEITSNRFVLYYHLPLFANDGDDLPLGKISNSCSRVVFKGTTNRKRYIHPENGRKGFSDLRVRREAGE